jgi:hypothetical protein
VQVLSQTQNQASSVQEGMPGVIPVKKGKSKSALGAFSRILDGLKSNPQGNFFKISRSKGKISIEDVEKNSLSLQKASLKDKKKTFFAGEDKFDPVFLEAAVVPDAQTEVKLFPLSPAGQEMIAPELVEGQVWGEKPDTGRIPPEPFSLESAPPLKQVQEIPLEHEAETEEAVLKDTLSFEDGKNNAVQLSPAGEGKSLRASEESRFIESVARNADEYPAPEKMSYNLSVQGQGDNTEKPLQNKTEGNPVHKPETAPARKVRERLSSDTREAQVREAPVTELVREVKSQTAGDVRGASEQEISVDLRNTETFEGIVDRNSGARQAPAESNFGELLSRQLNEGLSTDIVRHASIILRGNDSGLIRLTLKPETLGNVKIRLEMSENKIIGHIVVESKEALRAFEEEAHVLEAAFKEAGFDGASLDMSLASGNGSGEDGRGERMDRDVLSSLRIAASYDASSMRTEDGSGRAGGKAMYTVGRSAINMLV